LRKTRRLWEDTLSGDVLSTQKVKENTRWEGKQGTLCGDRKKDTTLQKTGGPIKIPQLWPVTRTGGLEEGNKNRGEAVGG